MQDFHTKRQILLAQTGYTALRILKKGFKLHAESEIRKEIENKTEIDKWLTEPYCLYLEVDKKFFRYDLHHKESRLKHVTLQDLKVKYQFGAINLGDRPQNATHYSDGVKIIAWKRQKI